MHCVKLKIGAARQVDSTVYDVKRIIGQVPQATISRNSKKQDEQDMSGTLIFPEKKRKTYPLVICMHGSLGWRGHHHEHAVNFLNNGFAIFRVNSFDARQVVSIVAFCIFQLARLS